MALTIINLDIQLLHPLWFRDISSDLFQTSAAKRQGRCVQLLPKPAGWRHRRSPGHDGRRKVRVVGPSPQDRAKPRRLRLQKQMYGRGSRHRADPVKRPHIEEGEMLSLRLLHMWR